MTSADVLREAIEYARAELRRLRDESSTDSAIYVALGNLVDQLDVALRTAAKLG